MDISHSGGLEYSLLLLVLLIFLSAFFSGIETAITAVNKIKIRNLRDKKDKQAIILHKLLATPGKIITTILIANNLVNIAASSLATAMAIGFFGPEKTAIAALVSTVLMTTVILVFGEVFPKNFAMVRSESVSLKYAGIIQVFTYVMTPITSVFSFFSRSMIKMLTGSVPARGSIISEEELKYMLKISEEQGIIEEEEKAMIQGIFDLGKDMVREIMTPRPDINFVSINTSVNDVIALIQETGHSRIPVFEETIDHIKGIIFAKDLLNILPEDRMNSVEKYIKEPYFVPETKKLDELLAEMKKTKSHIAIAVDEYGGTAGVVSIEDILEQIVGEIQDEYDEDEPVSIKKISDYEYDVSAGILIDDLDENLSVDLPKDDEFDTLGGFLFFEFGRIPDRGDTLNWRHLSFMISEVVENRIIRVRLKINEIISDPNDSSNLQTELNAE